MEQEIRVIKEAIIELGRDENSVLVVAATKTVDVERINRLKDYGIFDAGENRVQELLQKYDSLSDIRWHFIGCLQKNKVKYIVDKVCLIHSVDSQSLGEVISRNAARLDRTIDVLAEVNIGGEITKSGVCGEKLLELCDQLVMLPSIRLRGIMSVMPPDANEDLYRQMQQLFEQTKKRYGSHCDVQHLGKGVANVAELLACGNNELSNSASIDFLSVGMSSDYKTALRYGANIIRPGSAIFGKRNYI